MLKRSWESLATPLFSRVIIAVIALGIGINAGLLTVLNVYAWQPAPDAWIRPLFCGMAR